MTNNKQYMEIGGTSKKKVYCGLFEQSILYVCVFGLKCFWTLDHTNKEIKVNDRVQVAVYFSILYSIISREVQLY